MKQQVLIFVWIVLSVSTFAQTQHPGDAFEAAAKIILLNNDTLYGTALIDSGYKKYNFKDSDIGQVFFFKENGKTKPGKFRPKDINGFQVKTADSLWSDFISSQTLTNFIGESFYEKKFLLKILEGKISVYYYYHIDNISIGRPGTLDYSNFSEKNLTKILYKKDAAKIYHSDIYEAWRSKLYTFIKECPELVNKLKEVKCKGWSFLQIATYYNTCN